jgi:hypothetical protein
LPLVWLDLYCCRGVVAGNNVGFGGHNASIIAGRAA